jgi:hypothetical protein
MMSCVAALSTATASVAGGSSQHMQIIEDTAQICAPCDLEDELWTEENDMEETQIQYLKYILWC